MGGARLEGSWGKGNRGDKAVALRPRVVTQHDGAHFAFGHGLKVRAAGRKYNMQLQGAQKAWGHQWVKSNEQRAPKTNQFTCPVLDYANTLYCVNYCQLMKNAHSLLLNSAQFYSGKLRVANIKLYFQFNCF